MDLAKRLDEVAKDFIEGMKINPLHGKIVDGTASREEYVIFLTETLGYVRNGVWLLGTTGKNLEKTEYKQLAAGFQQHSGEEGGHEIWVMDDLRALGITNSRYLIHLPDTAFSPGVQAYNASSRKWAEQNPIAIVGLAYTLEKMSMSLGSVAANNLREKSGIPNIENALRFLDGHGKADIKHDDQNKEMLLTINEKDHEAVLKAGIDTKKNYLLIGEYVMRDAA